MVQRSGSSATIRATLRVGLFELLKGLDFDLMQPSNHTSIDQCCLEIMIHDRRYLCEIRNKDVAFVVFTNMQRAL
jgi:hypothetical protein